MDSYRTYRVSPSKRAGTVDWLVRGLQAAGCTILFPPDPRVAPFKVVFSAPDGSRMGAIFYLFTITSVPTKNRPLDEWRFQIKYGEKDGLLHEIWQDPVGLYTTVFLGIDSDTGCFVAADPVLHNPTRMFISLEFKQRHMNAISEQGWHAWERDSTIDSEEPTEVLVGGRPDQLLNLVRFERAAKGLDQGNRQLLAERFFESPRGPSGFSEPPPKLDEPLLHKLAAEFQMPVDAILDLINEAPRLKMAVRGWVAEDHLKRVLAQVPGVTDCTRLNLEGRPDVSLKYRGRPLLVECKNVLRQKTAAGIPRMDFQRTRASQNDRCTRYYKPDEFNVLAACMHAVSERWEFRYQLPTQMDPHRSCPGRLANQVKIDARWMNAGDALEAATSS